jgi:hypothetical protein
MRLSSLCLAAVLLFSSVVFAQHHESSTPSSPPPTVAPSPAPSPTPTSAPSAPPSISTNSAPSSSSSVTTSHSSAPSFPPSVSSPVSHVAPSTGPTTSHVTDSNIGRPAPVAHPPDSGSGRVIPAQKLTAEDKIAPAARVRENPPEKEREAKPAEPDLRHRICESGACKEPATKPAPPESDLRRHICLNGTCGCPAGQTASKTGCVSTAVTSPTNQCQPGEYWSGGACLPSSQCRAGEYWNGLNCTAASANCVTFIGRGAMLASELRSLKAQIQSACSQSPPAQECNDLKLRQMGAVQRYQMLMSEAGPTCWAALPDALSLE